MFEADFWKRVDYIRETIGLTWKKICAETGIKENTVKQWRHYIRTPDAESIVKIARCLNCSTDYLLTGQNHAYEYPHRILAIAEAAHNAPEDDLLLVERVLRIQKNSTISNTKAIG